MTPYDSGCGYPKRRSCSGDCASGLDPDGIAAMSVQPGAQMEREIGATLHHSRGTMANTLATSDVDTMSETMQDACVVCMAEAVPSCDEQILLEQLGSLHLGDGTQHEHHEQRKEAEWYGDLEVDAAADDVKEPRLRAECQAAGRINTQAGTE